MVMRINDVMVIKGRGLVAYVIKTEDAPKAGDTVRRGSDGATWTVAGVEQYARLGGAFVGEPIGLLLRGDRVFYVGDELERVPSESVETGPVRW